MISFIGYLRLTYKLNNGLSRLSLLKHRKLYKEWTLQKALNKSPLELELPWITIFAKNCIENFLREKLKSDVNVFEFGSGGSSLFFLKYSNKVVSVEHDKKWFDLVMNTINQKNLSGWEGHFIEPEQLKNISHVRLDASDPDHFYTTDKDFLNFTFKNYASYIDNFPDNYFDIILIDGRSRPSCIFHSINKIKKGGLLILDNAEREYYLSSKIMDKNKFNLIVSANSALICSSLFTQTNIYRRK